MHSPRTSVAANRAVPSVRPLVVLVVLAGLWAAGPLRAQPREVERATDILQHWQPGQHLYVKGNLGAGGTQLGELETWLRANATNWTVALLEQAADERFTDAAGESFVGMDAVEHALGKGLPNQTAFGRFTDPRTGEANGAFFVLFLRERKFSYFGSDAQDRRGLGEDRWVGQLDQPAIAAMRGGGRIIDAVKDTITHIDRALAQRISDERAQRERAEAAARLDRERAQAQARASLEAATAGLGQLEARLAAFKAGFPEANGDLARPPILAWQAEIEAAATALSGGHPAGARTLADAVRDRAVAAVNALEDYRRAGPELRVLSDRMDLAAKGPMAAAVKPQLDEVAAALAEARQAYERGESVYRERLGVARRQIEAAEAAIDAAIRAERVRRQTARGALVAGSGALLALGVTLNLRRRGRRREALALVDAWSQALDDKTLALFKLLDRTCVVVGSSADEARRRFAGATLAASEQVIRDVDELTIMSSCAGRILTEARALALPPSLPARARNLFFTGRYRAATRRLRDEPITFRPEEGLDLVMRGVKTDRDRLLGSLESYQPFQFSFTELITAFNQRAARALSRLDQIESALAGIGAKLEAVQQTVQAARALEARIDAAAGAHPFRAAPVFAELLPSAERALAEAVQVSIRDSVGALDHQLAAAERQAADALALAELSLGCHEQHRPQLETAANELAAAGLQVAWLPAAVDRLSARADQLALDAVQAAAAPGIAELRAHLVALVEQAGQVVALDRVRRDAAPQSIGDARSAVAATRAELAGLLGKKPGDILREPDLDPSEQLAQAEAQLLAVKAALERGATTEAQDGLAEVTRLAREAVATVEATRQAFAAHAPELAARIEETERLARAVPDHETVLTDLAARYAPRVLELGRGDPAHPNANGTVRDNLDEARAHLARCRDLAAESAQAFRDAQILHAADQLRRIAALQTQAAFRLQEIREKQQRIGDTEAANDTLVGQLNIQVRDLTAGVGDARTTRTTAAALAAARARLAETIRLQSVTPRDPFAVAEELAAVRAALQQVADQVRRDWEGHAAAGRSLEGAAAELEVARRLQRDAAGDAVPDSRGIVQAGGAIEALSASLAAAQARLRDPHGDWLALDAEATGLAQEAERLAATLRGELEAAEKTIASLNSAAARVRAAGSWAGGLGVLITGAPGAEDLAQARRVLATGNYAEAWRLAEAARRSAELAIAQAEAEIEQRRRAEAERIARERRAREAAERARQSSIGTGGFGRSRSGFSVGSGARSSSFRSGSGTRRSGW